MKNSAIAKFQFSEQPPKPPTELGKAGRNLWRALTSEYAIYDAGGLAHLLSACRSEDDAVRLKAIIAKDGDVIVDRFGQKQAHPLLSALRAAETSKRQSLQALHLDIEPLKGGPGRPAGH